MLEMKTTCERCGANLAPDSEDAAICSYECTFCISCATENLQGICPNCNGSLLTRPPRR